MNALIKFFLLLLVPNSLWAAPAQHEGFYLLSGNMINIEDGARVQGSVAHGGLQPDYAVNFNDESMHDFLMLAEEIGQKKISFWEKLEELKQLVNMRSLPRKAYDDPQYLKLLETYRMSKEDVPLAKYIDCGAGVCRENGMLLHLALKKAGIDNNYVYANVTYESKTLKKTEGHGFTVILHDGKNRIVDSYNAAFDGEVLEDLLKPGGIKNKDYQLSINRISNYPLVWNPKQSLKSIIGQGFIKAPMYTGPDINVGEFVEPNELHPEVARGLYSAGQSGVHIAVGTERGYIGFAMNPQATHLLLADIDAQVVHFNKINIALLQLSEGFEDYKNLRLSGNHEDWLKKLQDHPQISKEMFSTLQNPAVFEWWRQRVAKSDSYKKKIETLGLSSYLNDPGKFHRLYKAAKEGRIQSLRLNLVDTNQLTSIAREMQAKNLQVSVLDMSSAWMPRYITNTGVHTMLDGMKTVFSKDSILLLTKGDVEYGHWKYTAYSGQYIQNASKNIIEGQQIQNMFDNYKKPRFYSDTRINVVKSKLLLWFETFIYKPKAPICSQVFN